MSSNPSQEQLLSQEAEGILEGKDLEKVVGGLKLPSCISRCFGGGSKTAEAGKITPPADLATLPKAAEAEKAARGPGSPVVYARPLYPDSPVHARPVVYARPLYKE